MKLTIANQADDLVEVRVQGNITQKEVVPTADPLAELLGPTSYEKLVALDLADAGYLDSSGVGWLLACHKRFRQAGGKMVIHSLQPVVANVLRVLKLDGVFHVAPNGPAARAALQSTPAASAL